MRTIMASTLSKDDDDDDDDLFDASKHADENGYPRLIVFDLDACFEPRDVPAARRVRAENNVIDEKTGMCVGAVSGRTAD